MRAAYSKEGPRRMLERALAALRKADPKARERLGDEVTLLTFRRGRATELSEQTGDPAMVAALIGNDPRVAMRHYVQWRVDRMAEAMEGKRPPS